MLRRTFLGAGAAALLRAGNELIVCGWDEVFILDAAADAPRKLWSWKAPERFGSRFRTTDECKPVDGGSRILITSSSDGVALVERGTGNIVFWAVVVNAHSAEMLPNGRIVVAASHRPGSPGDRLILFDAAKPEVEISHTELYSGHGVVWDRQRRLLWALGGVHLRAYTPSLSMAAEYALPDESGHDLQAVPGSPDLSVTTHHGCWLFDREKRAFRPHPQLAREPDVKCISVNPTTGQLVYTKADAGNWWTETLRFLNPPKTMRLPGEPLYKVRWNH
ncbi:MAG TPA: DUF6528 family protein [Bryobacteraceae bacterium]|nr:DUF6528 family protein [Bryobacteraceae bacterium]